MTFCNKNQSVIERGNKQIGSIYQTIVGSYNPAFVIVFSATVTCALFLMGCGNSATDSKATQNANTANAKSVEVQIVEAISRDVPRFVHATGSFSADETTDVASEVAGRVASVLVSEGDFVQAGSVVVKLSEQDARLRLEQARALELQGKAQVRQAEAQVRQAQAQLGLDKGGNFVASNTPAVREARAALLSAESDLRLAQANERRYASLLDTGDTSRLVYDQRRNELEKAQATVGEARERLQNAENTARGGNQVIEAARANLENVRAALANARSSTSLAEKTVRDAVIRAPLAGFVSSKAVAIGEYVSPNSPVLTIVRTSPIKLRLNVPESQAGAIQAGMSVSTRVAAQGDREFAGRVSAINPNLNETARTLAVEVVFDNTDNLLRPGMFAAAQIQLAGGEEAIYIPRTALVREANTDSVAIYVVQNNTARLRIVQVDEDRLNEDEEVRILSGLASGERVAVGGEQLFDGANVTARN